jgi:hypothetical protein
VAQNRNQTVAITIRMTEDEKKRLDDAVAKLAAGAAKLGPWMKKLALAEADRVLAKRARD